MGLFALAWVQNELERLLEAVVDLIPEADLKAGVRPDVERDLPGAAVKRYDGQRLDDIATAVTATRSHLARGEPSDGLVFEPYVFACWRPTRPSSLLAVTAGNRARDPVEEHRSGA